MAERASATKSKAKKKPKSAKEGEIVDLAKARKAANKAETKAAAKVEKAKKHANEGHNGGVPDEIVERHNGLIDAAEAALEKAKAEHDRKKGALKAVWNLAKEDGVDVGALRKLRKEDKRDHGEVVQEYAAMGRYAKIIGSALGTQFNLFSELEDAPAVVDVAMQGLRAGKGGEPRTNNPHTPGTADFAVWDDNHVKGQAELSKNLTRH